MKPPSNGEVQEHLSADSPPAVPDREGLLKKWAFSFDPGENGLLGAVRSWFRIFFIMAHEFSEISISLRASALTYSIVLSMVPILAMSTAVLKGLGSDNQLKTAAYRFIDQLEPEPAIHDVSPVQPGDGAVTGQGGEEMVESGSASPSQAPAPDSDAAGNDQASQSITVHLRNAVDTIFDYVDRTNFAAIGLFGIIGLLLAVILVLSTVENAMNEIWHSKKGRSLFRKVMDYLALLILLPISINIALAGDAILESPRIMTYIHTIIPSAWAVKMLLKLLPFLFVILTLMLMYQFFPNVRVKTHAAFAGALFAGFFWFLVQRVYIDLQIGVANYNAIYGSFATVPLFLIWIYLGWIFVLLGATLAYAVQNRHLYWIPGTTGTPQRNLQLAFDILNTVYAHFGSGKTSTIEDLIGANAESHPGNIQEITDWLQNGGLLHLTENNDHGYVPVMPAENLEAKDVVQLILGREQIATTGGDFSRRVIEAAAQAIPGDAFPTDVHPASESAPEGQDEEHEETV